MRPLREIRLGSAGSGRQNTVSLTQYDSPRIRLAMPKASNISIERHEMPSAWPRSIGPSRRSTTIVRISGNAASWAATMSPAGPVPTMRTSTSEPSMMSAAGWTRGSPG